MKTDAVSDAVTKSYLHKIFYTLLLAKAKKDIPLYFKDFKSFWDATTSYFNDTDLANCYKASVVFKNWLISLNHIGIKNLDSILKEIHEDINASFFHSYFGHYRSAHMHLRSVIELSLQLLFFFQHEIEFIQWKTGEFRIKHEELTAYLKKHPYLKNTSGVLLIDDITKHWKLFSKYIHAEAPAFFQTNLQSSHTKTISPGDFGKWKSSYLKTVNQINRLFLLFFNNKINSFPTQQKELLLSILRKKDLTELGFSI